MAETDRCGGDTERIEELDDMTLTEYPYQVELRVSILANPDNDPEGWAENVEMVVKDALSSVPCTVDSAVLERSAGTDTDRSEADR